MTGIGSRAERARLQRALEQSERRLDDLRRQRSAESRAYDQTIWALASVLGEVEQDLERVAESRTWRLGHWAASVVHRLRGSRTLTPGAVEVALRRIESI